MNIKLFIATPAFDGKVNVQYAISLAETTLLLAKNHIQVEYRIVTSGSLLAAERNRLVESFRLSDCTHMLCVDSDLGWPPQAVLAMLSKQEEFIAGVYPARIGRTFQFRGCLNQQGGIICNPEKGLMKMEYIPSGFMLLSKSAIGKMIATHGHTKYTPKDENLPSGHALFNTEIWEGEFWGEDFVFCRRAREAGLEIWVDPLIQFDHSGVIGMLAELLTDKKPE